MAKNVYMVIDKTNWKVTQLGELNVVTSKQFLEDPEAEIYTAPAADGKSYTVFSIPELQQICKNEGIWEEGMDYQSTINVLRLHLQERFQKEWPTYHSYEWYEAEIRKKEAADPEYYAKFKPEPPKGIPDSFVRSGRISMKSPNASNKPRTAGATGKVWEIADKVKEENPRLDAKGLRPLIIEACVKADINPATASTQYSKWKNAQNWE